MLAKLVYGCERGMIKENIIMNNKPSFSAVLKTGLIAGATAAAINTVIWVIGQLTGGMTIPLILVIAFSIIGIVIGGLIYFVLTRFLGNRSNLVFTIISILFLIVYAFAPIGAMSAEPGPGMGVFNLATVIATEIFHLVAGWLAIKRYTNLMRN